jgi:hypothetical protein
MTSLGEVLGLKGPYRHLMQNQEFGMRYNRAQRTYSYCPSSTPDPKSLLQHYQGHNPDKEVWVEHRQGLPSGFSYEGNFYCLIDLFPNGHYPNMERMRESELIARIIGLKFPNDRSVLDRGLPDCRPHLPIPQGAYLDVGSDSFVARTQSGRVYRLTGGEDEKGQKQGNTNIREGLQILSHVEEAVNNFNYSAARDEDRIQGAVVCVCGPSVQHVNKAVAASPPVAFLHFGNLSVFRPDQVPGTIENALKNLTR